MKKFLLTICLCLGLSAAASAQQKLELTLDEAINIALSDNPTVQVANLEIERYDYVRKQALSSLYPQVDASAQYALAEMLRAACDGELDFVTSAAEYARRAKISKQLHAAVIRQKPVFMPRKKACT